MTEQEFGDKVGASRAVVSNWNRQHSPPSRMQQRKIEQLTGFDFDTLMERLVNPRDFPATPLQGIYLQKVPKRIVSEPSGEYSPKPSPLLDSSGLDARLHRIEVLLQTILEKMSAE